MLCISSYPLPGIYKSLTTQCCHSWKGYFQQDTLSGQAQTVKNLPAVLETHVGSLGWEDPLEEGMALLFLPGESEGRRSLVGDSPWGHTELNTTGRLWLYMCMGWGGVKTPRSSGCLRLFTTLCGQSTVQAPERWCQQISWISGRWRNG